MTSNRMIFVNKPVKNLEASVEFFTKLGFKFDKRFTDEKGTCMIISDDAFVMLLVEEFFESFTKKPVADTSNNTEAIIALTAQSRDEVDDLATRAMAAGATAANEPMDDYGMYGRSFRDLDGHLWEVFYMDQSGVSQSGA